MIARLMLFGILSLLGQAPTPPVMPTTPPVVPTTPEVVRVLAIEARQVDGAPRYVAPSLAPVLSLLDQVPGNHFTEISFQEISLPYGQEGHLDLGAGGYSFWFRPSEFSDSGDVIYECHVDLKDGDKAVEALRVNGKLPRGKGTAFRGLPLTEGEMMVVMSIASPEDHSKTSDSGGSGDGSKSTGEGGGKTQGQDDGEQGPNGPEGEKKDGARVPELESRAFVPAPAQREVPQEAGAITNRATPPPEDLATIEGILRALEEQDMQEQKNSRNRRYDVVIRGDWW